MSTIFFLKKLFLCWFILIGLGGFSFGQYLVKKDPTYSPPNSGEICSTVLCFNEAIKECINTQYQGYICTAYQYDSEEGFKSCKEGINVLLQLIGNKNKCDMNFNGKLYEDLDIKKSEILIDRINMYGKGIMIGIKPKFITNKGVEIEPQKEQKTPNINLPNRIIRLILVPTLVVIILSIIGLVLYNKKKDQKFLSQSQLTTQNNGVIVTALEIQIPKQEDKISQDNTQQIIVTNEAIMQTTNYSQNRKNINNIIKAITAISVILIIVATYHMKGGGSIIRTMRASLCILVIGAIMEMLVLASSKFSKSTPSETIEINQHKSVPQTTDTGVSEGSCIIRSILLFLPVGGLTGFAGTILVMLSLQTLLILISPILIPAAIGLAISVPGLLYKYLNNKLRHNKITKKSITVMSVISSLLIITGIIIYYYTTFGR